MLVPTSTSLLQKPVGVSGGGLKRMYCMDFIYHTEFFITGLRGPYGKGLVGHYTSGHSWNPPLRLMAAAWGSKLFSDRWAESVAGHRRGGLWPDRDVGPDWPRRAGLQCYGGGASPLERHAGQSAQTNRPVAHATRGTREELTANRATSRHTIQSGSGKPGQVAWAGR